MAIPAAVVATFAANEAKGVLEAAAGVAIAGEAGYIATGAPTGVIASVGVGLARAACRRYAGNPGGVSAEAGARFEKACRPYLDSIGEGTGLVPNAIAGGQCAGQGYAVYYENRTSGSPQYNESSPIVVFGPIRGRSIVQTGTGPSVTTLTIQASNNLGQPQNFTATVGVASQFVRWGRMTTSPPGGDILACGNAPPTVTQPQPPANPRGPVFPINISPSVNVDAVINIGAQGDIDITIGDTTVNIDPFGGLPGDGSDPPTGGGGDEPGLEPGDQGDPGGEVVAPGGEDAEGEAPPGFVLVGLKITSLEPPPFAQTAALGVFRGAAYIYMGGDAGLDLDPAGATISLNQFIFAEKDNLTKWRVRANVGFEIGVTPYYREATT